MFLSPLLYIRIANLSFGSRNSLLFSSLNSTMASCTAPSSLMLSHPQDLSSSLRSFPHTHRPISTTSSFYPLVLKPFKWLHREPNSRSSHAVVAALAAEVQVPETVDDTEDGADDSAAATTAKPKKGKAALPLKRDRVCMLFWILFHVLLSLN